MAQGALTALLRNAIYIGKIVHKGTVYDGQHDGIVEPSLFDAVQARLDANNADRASGKNWKAPSLLAGLLYDTHGRKMTPGHATKRKRRYRYYLTHGINVTPDGPPTQRIPAHDIEAIVRDRLIAFLKDRAALLDTFGAKAIEAVTAATDNLREKLEAGSPGVKAVFADVISRIDIRASELVITLKERSALGSTANPVTLTAPAIKVRAGKQTKMVIDASGRPSAKIDRKLVALLGEAIAVRDMLIDGSSLQDAAEAIGTSAAYTARKARIGWLSPDIVTAIVEGRQPANLTRRALSQASNIPLDWKEQRRVLGFDLTKQG